VANAGHRGVPRRRRQDERGAALVELALVVPILMLLVFGIVEFGTAFNASQSLRQGVREAARQGAVGNFGSTNTTGSPCYLTGATLATTNVKNLICLAKSQSGLNAQNMRVKVLSGTSDFSSTGTFSKTDSVIVCAEYSLGPMSKLMSPFIGGSVLKTKTSMRIEVTDISATADGETALTGSDWSWCTVSSTSP
jgi:Flp pilus assembly protein TadG